MSCAAFKPEGVWSQSTIFFSYRFWLTDETAFSVPMTSARRRTWRRESFAEGLALLCIACAMSRPSKMSFGSEDSVTVELPPTPFVRKLLQIEAFVVEGR